MSCFVTAETNWSPLSDIRVVVAVAVMTKKIFLIASHNDPTLPLLPFRKWPKQVYRQHRCTGLE